MIDCAGSPETAGALARARKARRKTVTDQPASSGSKKRNSAARGAGTEEKVDGSRRQGERTKKRQRKEADSPHRQKDQGKEREDRSEEEDGRAEEDEARLQLVIGAG